MNQGCGVGAIEGADSGPTACGACARNDRRGSCSVVGVKRSNGNDGRCTQGVKR